MVCKLSFNNIVLKRNKAFKRAIKGFEHTEDSKLLQEAGLYGKGWPHICGNSTK